LGEYTDALAFLKGDGKREQRSVRRQVEVLALLSQGSMRAPLNALVEEG
jgi:hypothetical protein